MLDRIISARTALLLDFPFFGALALGLRLQEDQTCPTGWVDGRSLGYNPVWVGKQTNAQLMGFIAHEVMHVANGHPWRRDGRQFLKWNIACDKAINTTLAETKLFTMPNGIFYSEGDEIGQSSEWIYARLPDPPPQSNSPQGEVRDAPTQPDADGEAPPTEAEWQQAVKTAAISAKNQGKLPGNLERMIAAIGTPRVDWKSALRRFIQERSKSDYIWTRPSSRYLSQGLYLPALESHELGKIAIGVDTSGSIDDVALAMAQAEVVSVMNECNPAEVVIYYADARVARADRFLRGDPLIWRPAGGGGTDFRPVFKAAEEEEEQPVCLIYISDLCGTFPAETSVPTIWVTDTEADAPIGETVRVS